MALGGRYVAGVFGSYVDHVADEYLGPSGHLDPKTAVRLYDLCQLLYEEDLDFAAAEDRWDEWESVLRCFAEGCPPASLAVRRSIAMVSATSANAVSASRR